MGGGTPDEDPVPVDRNPHPQPADNLFHPNQLNYFIGPIQQHQAQDVMPQNEGNFHQQAMEGHLCSIASGVKI